MPRVLVATGKYIGEGFDDGRLDNLFTTDDVASAKRLVRDGVDVPLASLFVDSARPVPIEAEGIERARSATEAFFYRRLETLDATKRVFVLNAELAIPFDGWSKMEVDLLSRELRLLSNSMAHGT